jgi:ABC-type sugar transport system ATPase subunit
LAEIKLDGVGKVYPDGTRAVGDMDLTINDGEFLVLVGPSGCGKTTALRMIAGLEEITEGTITIGDKVVNDVAPKDRDIATHVGVRQHGLRSQAEEVQEGGDPAPGSGSGRHPRDR